MVGLSFSHERLVSGRVSACWQKENGSVGDERRVPGSPASLISISRLPPKRLRFHPTGEPGSGESSEVGDPWRLFGAETVHSFCRVYLELNFN